MGFGYQVSVQPAVWIRAAHWGACSAVFGHNRRCSREFADTTVTHRDMRLPPARIVPAVSGLLVGR
jgi:hypothetical protein